MTNPLLERRRIEAEFTKGILETLAEEIGHERAISVLTKAIETMAETAGRAFAAEMTAGRPEASPDLQAFAPILPHWQAGGALSVSMQAQDARHFDFDVTHCAFADMYREMGLGELGQVLSCNRDASFVKGFNGDIELTRTQTIMGGASHCDFRFRYPGAKQDSES